MPYSVTTYMTLVRVSVTAEPGTSVGRMRLWTSPVRLLVKVDDRQMKLLPPSER